MQLFNLSALQNVSMIAVFFQNECIYAKSYFFSHWKNILLYLFNKRVLLISNAHDDCPYCVQNAPFVLKNSLLDSHLV